MESYERSPGELKGEGRKRRGKRKEGEGLQVGRRWGRREREREVDSYPFLFGKGIRDSLVQAFLSVPSHVEWLLGGEWEGNQVHLSPKGLVGRAAEAGPRAPDSVLEFAAVEHSGTF